MEFEQISLDDPMDHVYDDIFSQLNPELFIDDYVQDIIEMLDQDIPLIDDNDVHEITDEHNYSLPNTGVQDSVSIDHNYDKISDNDMIDDLVDVLIRNLF